VGAHTCGSSDQIHDLGSSGRVTRSVARAGRPKSGSANFPRRRSRRTVRKKFRFERKGRRSFDTGLEYDTASVIANQETRTAKPAVRATRLIRPLDSTAAVVVQ